jgi:hypothetical protein
MDNVIDVWSYVLQLATEQEPTPLEAASFAKFAELGRELFRKNAVVAVEPGSHPMRFQLQDGTVVAMSADVETAAPPASFPGLSLHDDVSASKTIVTPAHTLGQ